MEKNNNGYTASYKRFRGTVRELCSRKRIRNSGIQRALLEKQNELLKNAKSGSRAFRGPKAGKYFALEDELITYFEELMNDGIAVTHDILQLRAGELAKYHNISDNESKASRGWLQRSMKRKGLSLRIRTTLLHQGRIDQLSIEYLLCSH
jgi:hypothetical protein